MVGKILQAAFGLLLLGSNVAVFADEAEAEAQVLVLKFSDATTADFYLADKPVIGFSDDKIVVTSGSAEVEYDQSAVTEYYFASSPTSSIQGNAAGAFTFKYTDNARVYVSGTKAAKASLCDMSGKQISASAVDGGKVTVSLDGCAPGVYVLNLENEKSFKIIKK